MAGGIIGKLAFYGTLTAAAICGGCKLFDKSENKPDHSDELRELRAYRDDIEMRSEEAGSDKELNIPHKTLTVTGTPQPEREVYLSWGKFRYKGEAIKLNLKDDDGNVYDVTVINNCGMKQDEFIESWLALLNGGYGFRIREGAKQHYRCEQQQANGMLPFPVSAEYEKDKTGVKQSMEIFIDDPRYVDMVPIMPGDRHYPVTAMDAGLEIGGRLQLDGLTPENVALAEQFLERHSEDLSAREIRALRDIMAVTENIRNDTLNRMADAYEQRLRNSEEVLLHNHD